MKLYEISHLLINHQTKFILLKSKSIAFRDNLDEQYSQEEYKTDDNYN